jgi:hypothetical protein
MTDKRRPRKTILSILATIAFVLGLATPAAASDLGAQAWTGSCPSQYVCFYSGDNGTGSRCAWTGQDNDWLAGTIVCSWARNTRVQSVWNNGTSGTGVSYYTSFNFSGRVGCTASGTRGNFAGNNGAGYFLQSHRWDC